MNRSEAERENNKREQEAYGNLLAHTNDAEELLEQIMAGTIPHIMFSTVEAGMAERIDMWKSTDGKIHATEYDANFHNNYLEVLEAISEEFYRGCCESASDFVDFVLQHQEDVEKLFNMSGQK